MFSLPTAADCLVFLLARSISRLSREPPLTLVTTPTHPDPHKHSAGLWGGASKGEEAGKGTEVGGRRRVCAKFTGPWTGRYKHDWVWPLGTGILSRWKRLALNDSAAKSTATEEETQCSVPNSFQTVQNRPVNPSLMVTKCEAKDERVCYVSAATDNVQTYCSGQVEAHDTTTATVKDPEYLEIYC